MDPWVAILDVEWFVEIVVKLQSSEPTTVAGVNLRGLHPETPVWEDRQLGALIEEGTSEEKQVWNISVRYGWLLLLLYVLATSKVILEWILTSDSAHLWQHQGAVAESIERRPRVREIESLILGQVKPVTYKVDTCHFLAWCLALIGYGKDWLAQCQDNGTEWDIRSWCQQSDFPVGQYYKVVMSVHCHKLVPILIRM